MEISVSPIVFVALLASVLALVAIVVALRMRPTRPSPIAVAGSVLPALLMLVLFYSLAIHMRWSLGAWPASIGEQGFPAPLVTHASFAGNYFIILLVGSVLAWPAAFLLCLLVRHWSVCIYYLGVYAFACLVCFGAMLLAPSQFLNWWWD